MSSGDVSPINVAAIVQGLMLKEQVPLDRLKKAEKNQEVQLTVYGQLQSLLQTFQTSLTALTTAFNAIAYQATSSNPAAISAQITGNDVAPVQHTLDVTQLAQAESQISVPQSSNNAALGISDTLGFSVGSKNFSVDVTSTDTLQNIRDRINKASDNPGVSASILATTSSDGQPQYQLVVSSNQTGVANAVSVTDSSGEFGFSEQSKAQDAVFTFDGQNVDRASNNVSDVIDGLSFTLLQANTGSVTINVGSVDPATQTQAVMTSVKSMLDAYNNVLSAIDKLQVDPATRNDTFPMIKVSLQNLMSSTFTGSGPYQSLSDIGIVLKPGAEQTATIDVVDKDGKDVDKQVKYYSTGQLMLSSDIPNIGTMLPGLEDALTNNFAAVQNMLTNAQSGLLTAMSKDLDPLTGNLTQSIKSSMTNLNQQEQYFKQKITDENSRLDQVEQMLTGKYASLNVLLEKLQATNDYLTKQLDNINNETSRGYK